jgi:hypothetical protein
MDGESKGGEQQMIDEDYERTQFLEQLAHSHAYLTEWEAKFLDDMLEKDEFSEGQRTKIDQMRKRYGRDL